MINQIFHQPAHRRDSRDGSVFVYNRYVTESALMHSADDLANVFANTDLIRVGGHDIAQRRGHIQIGGKHARQNVTLGEDSSKHSGFTNQHASGAMIAHTRYGIANRVCRIEYDRWVDFQRSNRITFEAVMKRHDNLPFVLRKPQRYGKDRNIT